MNKTQLREDFIAKGWTVAPVETWMKVSEVEDISKYDVNVVSPTDQFQTAQMKVVDDGTDDEAATALGAFVEAEETFADKLRTFLDTIEASAGIFAVSVTDTKESDSVAVCRAYLDDGTVSDYVVKEREGTFSFKELV